MVCERIFSFYEHLDGVSQLGSGLIYGTSISENKVKYTNSNNGGIFFWKNKISSLLFHWVD
jgi:hypothetical protein